MEKALIQYMVENGIADGRVYPVSAPQGVSFPYVLLTRIFGGPEYADDGDIGLEHPHVQIDCRGLTFADGKDLAAQVKALLSGVRDLVYQGVTFRYIMVTSEIDIRESDKPDAVEYIYNSSVDFDVWNVIQEG